MVTSLMASLTLVADVLFFFCFFYCFACTHFFFFFFFGVFLLHVFSPVHYCNGVWVIVTQYTSNITITGDLDFVVSMPQTIGLASSEALSPCIFVLSLNFGLPNPNCVLSFL
jgi:hypothetical protein